MKQTGYLWVFLLLTSTGNAQPTRQDTGVVPVQAGATGTVSLRHHLFHLIDSTGQLRIGEVIKRQRAGQFRPSVSQTIRQDFGYNTTATHWLYFRLRNPANAPRQTRLMLEIEYANLDELQLYEVNQDSIQTTGPTGDRFPYPQRPYQNNNYVFPISLRAGQQADYYVRVRQPHAVLSFAVQLWHRTAFVAANRTRYALWGGYVGIICMVLVLNLVMLLALRDRIYSWYSLYLHFITMHLFTDAGLSFQYLWPTVPDLNEFLPIYLYVWASVVAQTTFMQHFIRQNRHNSRVYRWINGFKIGVTGLLAAAVLVPLLAVPGREQYMYQAVSMATSLLVPLVGGLTVISLYERRRDGGRLVRYYGYALAVQFVGYGLVAFMNFCQAQGWPLPFDVETYLILRWSVLIDLVFFTYGLTYRYTQANEQNQHLELTLLRDRQQAQQQVIASLETERQRLAQDLHDDVGPLLATAKGFLSRLFRTEPSPPLQRAQTLIDEAADELRTLSHQLLPRQNDGQSVADAIAEVCRKSGSRGVPVRFLGLGEVRPLDGPRGQLLFSIATQLIRHARQHPQVTDVLVQLLYHEEHLNLSVEDDGQPAHPSATDTAHLRAIADLLQADLLIDATETGNSVMVSVPIAKPVRV